MGGISFARAIGLGSLLGLAIPALGTVFTSSSLQVGGFYEGGGKNNDPSFQNYYVGYGTSAGPHSRTLERRSFFWFHVPSLDGPIVDATLTLKMLVSTSLIFGITDDPTVHDHTEEFQLGFTMAPKDKVIDPTIPTAEADAIFKSLDDHPIADPYVFTMDIMYDFPFAVIVHLNSDGIAWLHAHEGGDVVLSGWMPTWSYDDRKDDTGEWLEEDELLFGFSDVGSLVPFPELTITTESVPEPATLVFVGLVGIVASRRRKDQVVRT